MTYRWITLDNGRSVYRQDPAERGPASDLPNPMLIRDQMDDLKHPVTGHMIGSKSEFRAITKQNGGIELGNDRLSVKPHVDEVSSADVGEAIRKVKDGYKPQIGEGAAGWSDPTV